MTRAAIPYPSRAGSPRNAALTDSLALLESRPPFWSVTETVTLKFPVTEGQQVSAAPIGAVHPVGMPLQTYV